MSEFQGFEELMDYVNKEAERRVQQMVKQKQSENRNPNSKCGAPAGIWTRVRGFLPFRAVERPLYLTGLYYRSTGLYYRVM
jgi:hypothetical protein